MLKYRFKSLRQKNMRQKDQLHTKSDNIPCKRQQYIP